MTFILPHKVEQISFPYVAVCEGFGDVCLINRLLERKQIGNCFVGCPSRTGSGGDGKDFLGKYLAGLAAIASKASENVLKGVIVVLDADDDAAAAFNLGCEALQFAGFPTPDSPYAAKVRDEFKVGIYIVPGRGETGTLEHLLLRSVYFAVPGYEACVNAFVQCVGKSAGSSPNTLAKMKMSALVGASFPSNPWATPGPLLLSSENDLIPLDNPHFADLSNFLTSFCAK